MVVAVGCENIQCLWQSREWEGEGVWKAVMEMEIGMEMEMVMVVLVLMQFRNTSFKNDGHKYKV